MSAFLQWLCGATTAGTVAVLLTLFAIPAIRRVWGARAAQCLWVFPLLILLVPWPRESPVGVLPSAVNLPAVVVSVVVPTVSAAPPEAVARPDQRHRASIPWVFVIWATGFVASLVFLVFRAVGAGLLVRRSRDISASAAVQKALADLGFPRRVQIRETPDLLSPAVCGWWRPVILLPPGWAEIAEPDELRWVLLHEIGHIRRGDLLWRWVFQFARTVHWFNPVVWLANGMARRDQEMACDAWVLDQRNNFSGVSYGEVILRMAGRLGVPQLSSPAHAGMAEGRHGLSLRIRHLAQARPHGMGASLAALSLGALATLLLAPASAGPVPAQATPVPSNPDMARKQSVEVETKLVELSTEMAEQVFSNRPGENQTILDQNEMLGLLRSLNDQKGTDMMSAPKVTTLSGQRAVIQIVREFRYPTAFEAQSGKNAPPTPKDFETRNVGITLEVEPTVMPDGQIVCSLTPEIVEFVGFINYGANRPARPSLEGDAMEAVLAPVSESGQAINQPVFETRRIQTSVALRSGQTVVFGGLTREDKQTISSETDGKIETKEVGIRRTLYIFVTARLLESEGKQAEPVRSK